jgi:hypothetical protein
MKKLTAGGTDYGVNKKLLKILKKLVKNNITKESRKDAIDILSRCTDITIREFLHFSLLKKYNLACACLDFAMDKYTNKPIMNKSFGLKF